MVDCFKNPLFQASYMDKIAKGSGANINSEQAKEIHLQCNYYSVLSVCKNWLNSSTHSWHTAEFSVPWLKGHVHFWPTHHKIINFYLSWICISKQKISLFHRFILVIQSVLRSHDQSDLTFFWPCTPKKVSINFMKLNQQAKK